MENLNIGEQVSVVTTPFMPIGTMTKKPKIESREEVLEKICFGEFQELYPLLQSIGFLSERERLSIAKVWLKEGAPEHVKYYGGDLLFGNYQGIKTTDAVIRELEERENGRK